MGNTSQLTTIRLTLAEGFSVWQYEDEGLAQMMSWKYERTAIWSKQISNQTDVDQGNQAE